MAKQPMEDFFRNSDRTAYQISPDGRHFSYMATYENRMNIFVQSVEGGEPLRLTSETERSVAGYMWADNERILFTILQTANMLGMIRTADFTRL